MSLYNEHIVVAGIVHSATIMGEIVTHAVNAEAIDGEEGIDHHTCGFGHLLVSEGPMRVGENLLGQRKVKSHEEGWPVNAMESDYILAYHVTVRRPTSAVLLSRNLKRIFGLGEVTYQGI